MLEEECLPYIVVVIQWITSCHKNCLTTRVVILWRVRTLDVTDNVRVNNAFSY